MTPEIKNEIAKEVKEQIQESIKNDVIPAVEGAIEKHVNGGIRSLTKKVDDHIEKMEPVFEVYDTANRMGSFANWLSKVFVSLGLIVASIAGAIKFLGK